MKDKKLLKTLKMQKTKLINKSIKTVKEFEELQDKLHQIELEIKVLEKGEE